MINFLTGTVLEYKDQIITCQVAGIGFQLQVVDTLSVTKGEQRSFYVYLQWHQENGPVLYGFQTPIEKEVFLLIISCSGIGPKIALALLSAMTPGSFLKAVHSNDERILSSVSGIGAKKAEQIIMQLRHKVAKLIERGDIDSISDECAHWRTLSETLTSLNYSRTEINNALAHIKEALPMSAPFDQLLRKALSFLSKRV